MHPALYLQEKVCPVCSRKFQVTKVKASACPVLSRDMDFCVRYSGPVNPNYYAVWHCPNCGYAATDGIFDDLDDKGRVAVAEALCGREIPTDSPTERTAAMAIELYKQAVFCAEQHKVSRTVMAGLTIRIAWLYRELGDPAEEQYLSKALDLYQEAYDRERFPVGKMTAATVGYLIGELKRRLGHLRDASEWLSRLASDPRLREEPQIDKLARQQWQEAKAQLAAGLEGKTAWDGARPETAKPVERISVSLTLDGEAARLVRDIYDRARMAGGDLERADVVAAILDAVAGVVDLDRVAGASGKALTASLRAALPGGKKV